MKRVLLSSSITAIAIGASAQVNTAGNDSIKSLELDEVVISATKASKGTPMAFTDVSKEDLQKSNYGQDIPYLISQTPSVIVTSDAGTGIGYTGFRVRGTDANRINITVNGVPVNDSESHTVFWVNMPDFASSVENVQIQRGAGTSTNGAASFGASIAMQTQKPEVKPYAEYSTAAGSFSTFKNTFKGGTGLLYNKFTFDARYSTIDSKGYIDRAMADMSSYYGSATYFGEKTLIKYQIFGSAEKTNQAWYGVDRDKMLAGNRTYNSCGEYKETIIDENGNQKVVTRYYDNSDNYWQTHQHLNIVHQFDDKWNANMTVHYTNGKGYYEDYKTNRTLSEYGLESFTDGDGNLVKKSDLIRQKWLKNDFYGAIANVNYTGNRLTATLGLGANNYDGRHFGKVIWAKNYNNLKPDHTYYDGDGTKLDYNAFVKANYLITESLNIYADLQYRGIDYAIKGTSDKTVGEFDIREKFNFFNPKAGINFSKGGHNAFASFSVANREPNRNNFTDPVNTEVKPTYETLHDYELGYNHAAKRWNVGMNLYYMDYNNQLVLSGQINEIGEPLSANVKDSYRMGIELMAGVKLLNCLNWNGNMTLSRNKIRDYEEYIVDYSGGDPYTVVNHGTTDIAFSPDIIVNSAFDFNLHGFNANFSTSYVGRQYLDNTATRSRSIDAYFVSNLQVGYTMKTRLCKEIGLSFRINNIFNEEYETNGWTYTQIDSDHPTPGNRYEEVGYFTQAGTNFMGALTIKF